ncbi:MAG: YdiU family protein [Gemmatimonadetes bacterium]|nr:YdiU family protein [Gemmatimonadota bacterium]
MRSLTDLPFDNTYTRLPEAFYARTRPIPFTNPHLVSFNPAASELIDLDPAEAARPEFVEYFSGKKQLPGADPIAMLYAGHQFGQYVPQLGDGRAILIGEVRGRQGIAWDLHLKGGGMTPFSRGFDGRAVLRSTIREHLGSEAMHGLQIPTTRALCIIGSDEEVYRERVETGAMLVRLAPSHIRFGSFEVFSYRSQHDLLRQLADHTIEHHFPHLDGTDGDDRYVRFLTEVVERTARLVAAWQAVGFAHGVLNTDNMSIHGITMDYGPFGFLDHYDPGFIPNHSDPGGRYAFDQQPGIGLWNLSALAQALLPLMTREAAVAALDRYEPVFLNAYAEHMQAKLGLRQPRPEDGELLSELLAMMQASEVDYTNLFRSLASFAREGGADGTAVREMFPDAERFDAWAARYRARLGAEGGEPAARAARMNAVNPKYVLRNYLAEAAIRKAEDERDYSEIERLLALLRDPYSEQPEMEGYAAAPPEWGRQLVISCSS